MDEEKKTRGKRKPVYKSEIIKTIKRLKDKDLNELATIDIPKILKEREDKEFQSIKKIVESIVNENANGLEFLRNYIKERELELKKQNEQKL